MKEEIIFASVFTVTLFYLLFIAPQSDLSLELEQVGEDKITYGQVIDFYHAPLEIISIKGAKHDFSLEPMRVFP